MRRVQLYQDCNLTPVKHDNPRYKPGSAEPTHIQQWLGYDLLKSLGARDAFIVYDGTLCNAGTWYDPDPRQLLPPPTPEKGLDFTKQAGNNNPPVRWAVEACAHLTAYASTYQPKPETYPVQDHVPMMFDLEENPSVEADYIWDNVEVVREKVGRMTDAVRWARQWSPQNYTPIGAYTWPPNLPCYNDRNWMDPEMFKASGMLDFINVASFSAPSFYFWDVPAINPIQMFGQIDRATSFLDRYASHLPRWAVVTPTYQIYWPDNVLFGDRTKPLMGKAVDPAVWERFIAYLVERDYDLFVWNPDVDAAGVSELLHGLRKWVE